eukprot:COSAG01_NODE_3391_length_6151_cov_4.717944_3_plen_60_part_00
MRRGEAGRPEISPTFPCFYHRDKNRRRNGQMCMGISVTALVLITKHHARGGAGRAGGSD